MLFMSMFKAKNIYVPGFGSNTFNCTLVKLYIDNHDACEVWTRLPMEIVGDGSKSAISVHDVLHMSHMHHMCYTFLVPSKK